MFLDPERPIDRRQRTLPHWHQPEAVTFVTFRLADSIPAPALKQWVEDRRRWLLARGLSAEGDLASTLALLPEEQRKAYFREFGKRFHELLDAGHGSCVLKDPRCSGLGRGCLEALRWHSLPLGAIRRDAQPCSSVGFTHGRAWFVRYFEILERVYRAGNQPSEWNVRPSLAA
jgi:hypothetical protein